MKCQICRELTSDALMSKVHADKHASTACNKCLLTHAASQAKSMGGGRIRCLNPRCDEEVDLLELKAAGISASLFESLDRNKFHNWLNSQPDFR